MGALGGEEYLWAGVSVCDYFEVCACCEGRFIGWCWGCVLWGLFSLGKNVIIFLLLSYRMAKMIGQVCEFSKRVNCIIRRMLVLHMMEMSQIAKESPFPLDAFLFVQRGLEYTSKQEYGDAVGDEDVDSRHVSGEQLCWGLKDYAVGEYGLLALTVLRRWNILTSYDFGKIVFAMVDAGLLHKTEGDRLDDFEDVFDFLEAFPRTIHVADFV